jgi:trehalose-phosphatase
MEKLKPQWRNLIHPHPDIYLEDKGWSLALHAKNVDQRTAEQIIREAQKIVDRFEISKDAYRILGGHKFIEIAPRLANKGLTIAHLITSTPLNGALPVYIGDDDKDEEAFSYIIQNQGVAIKVSSKACMTKAQLRLENPNSVRQFLRLLL